MRSPVNWALLGLIIEQPSYAYDLAHRFERRYGDALPLSNVGHIYTALGVLNNRALVEEIPGTRSGRQPKPRYRATPEGQAAYREWIVEQVGEDRRRQEIFVLALAALSSRPDELAEVIARCEQEWLKAGMATPIGGEESEEARVLTALMRELIDEENRLAVGAKLAWIEYARQKLTSLRRR